MCLLEGDVTRGRYRHTSSILSVMLVARVVFTGLKGGWPEDFEENSSGIKEHQFPM